MKRRGFLAALAGLLPLPFLRPKIVENTSPFIVGEAWKVPSRGSSIRHVSYYPTAGAWTRITEMTDGSIVTELLEAMAYEGPLMHRAKPFIVRKSGPRIAPRPNSPSKR